MIKYFCTTLIVVVCLLTADAANAEESRSEAIARYKEHLLPFLQAHCFECHSEDTRKGELNLRALNGDLVEGGDAVAWAVVLERLETGEMPPKKRRRPPKAQLRDVVSWLTEELVKAEAATNAKAGPTVMRRLNRLEYGNTMRDLIGHPFDPVDLLSPDTVSHGFDNLGDALVVSPLHIDSFVGVTERILHKVIDISKEPPPRQHWRILNSAEAKQPLKTDDGSWHDGHRGKNRDKIKAGFLKGNVLPNIEIPSGTTAYTMIDMTQDPPRPYEGAWDIRTFGGSQIDEGVLINQGDNAFGFKWFAYEEGTYRVRLHVSSFGPKDWTGLPPKLGIALYPEGKMWRERLLKLNQSEVIEFDLYRDSIDWYRKLNGNRNWGVKLYYRLTKEADKTGTQVPFGVHISEIEIEGPINPTWPPAWHRRVFPERIQEESDEAYAKRVLRGFMTSAFRRPVSEDELSRMMTIYRKDKSSGMPLKQALRMPLATVLASPSFLYIANQPNPTSKSDQRCFELASRLSYFLWRSMPDEKLFSLAKSGDLMRRDVLLSEIDRMLSDPKSEALIGHFTRQWLGLDKLERLNVDESLYPEYDLALQQAMHGETTAFFREILREKLSIYSFIDSDFLILNERIAQHYGIPGVRGNAFRNVQRRPDDRRGGMLTQAAVLTATSNGVRTLPIKRGAFILENILADPPKPPPADVPSVEEVVSVNPRANLRERLEQHRSDTACMNCHTKIDPLGFALENYDAIGRWRNHELVQVDSEMHVSGPYSPSESITIQFANGSGEPNDWIAILPAAEQNNRNFKKTDLWKHTTDTQKLLPNGLFQGTVTLTAPNEPGDYEARLFFAGGYEAVARQKFSVAPAPLHNETPRPAPPLTLDSRGRSKPLAWVVINSAGKLPDGRAFENIAEVKRLLLQDKNAFRKCLTEKMLVYALGRPVTFGDRTLIKNTVSELERRPTIDQLIKLIVMSDSFFKRDIKP